MIERVLGRANDRWPLRNIQRRLRNVASFDVISAYLVLVTIVLVALCMFIANPVEPFAYDKDLGFAHMTAAGAVYTIHSLVDAFDAIAWTPWYNLPLFYLDSNVSEAFVTLVTWASGNAWLAIKIVEVFQVIVSVVAAFAMYATYSRNRFWALVFGFSYAALPLTVLAIRGNLAMGWLAAIAPAAIAYGTLLIRRYGARALPLVGFLCGFVGLGIALEYALFSSLPIFALILAGERRRLARADWVTFVPLALVCLLAAGAFYVLPSFVDPIISDAAARTTTLVTGVFLGNFCETWPGLLTFVSRESYVSAIPAYNADGAMPYLYLFGGIVWVAAVANLGWKGRSSAGWTDILSILLVAICVILAMGPALPLGQQLWNVLFRIPHINAIRTTDRFFLVPAVMLTFWYVCALERIATAAQSRKRLTGWLSMIIIIAFISFDISQHCFAVDPSKGVRQPQIDAVQAVVEAQGGRTASFAGVNGGWSFEESSEYGVPLPTTTAALELGWRFIEDGNGSIGVIGRSGVRTVISAPNWTNAPDFPNTAAIYRHLPSAPLLFDSSENVLVSKIAARDEVSSPTAVCVSGGPGGFDLLDNAPGIRGTAFLEGTGGCTLLGYVNFDPRDSLVRDPKGEVWAGSRVLPAQRQIGDNDYPFLPNRSLLKIPWYRNSIDGDRPVFDASGAVDIARAQSFVLPAHQLWPPGTSIAIRLSSHVPGMIAILVGAESIGSIYVTARPGFRWYEIRTQSPIPATAIVSVALQPYVQENQATWSGFALDGVAVRKSSVITRLPQRPAFVAISLDRFEHRDGPVASGMFFAPMHPSAGLIATNMHSDVVDGEPEWLADSANAQIRFAWAGAAGDYVIRAQAALTKPGDTLGIDATQNGTCCNTTAVNLAEQPSIVEGKFRLRKGSQIVVRLVSPAFESYLAERITVVSVRRVDPLLMHSATNGGSSLGGIDFTYPYDALAQLSTARGLTFKSSLAYGRAGSEMETLSVLSGHPKSVSLEVAKVGRGSATAMLRCDGSSTSEVALNEDDTALALSGDGFSRCKTRIRWSSGDLGVHSLRLLTGGAVIPTGVAIVWLPAGTYRASIIEADGKVMRRPPLRMAGCVRAEPVCTLLVAATHRIELGDITTRARLLTFTSIRPIAPVVPVKVQQTAALRWNLALGQKSTVELTQLYDANWILMDAHQVFQGERCDITNTCFPDVPPGRYRIYHRWPHPLQLGLALTTATLFASLALVYIRGPKHRRRNVHSN